MVSLCASTAMAQGLDTSDPSLPPTAAPYRANHGVIYSIPGTGQIVLHEFELLALLVTNRQNIGPDELQDYDAAAEGLASVNVPPVILPNLPFDGSGHVRTIALGKTGNTIGVFDTEMLAMNLAGNTPAGPFMIRESPTLPSLGRTSIADIGGGLYHIDSFFDVFTELSIDQGINWIPADHSMRIQLIPEPGIGLAAAAVAGVLLLARPRRRQQS